MDLTSPSHSPGLSPEEQKLFELMLREEGVDTAARTVPARGVDAELVLSYAQERLWFLEQLEPGAPSFHMSSALRLRGRLDTTALRRSLDQVLHRHEVLRTTFRVVDGKVVQTVAPTATMPFLSIDLRRLGEARCGAEVRRLAAEHAQRPFDLGRGPLARVALLGLGRDEHVLLSVIHHIAGDGWSSAVLVGELEKLYAAFSQGVIPALPELPVQYADFALWQRSHLVGETLEGMLGYWRDQLGSLEGGTELPADHPRPAVRNFRGGACTLELSQELSQRLRSWSRSRGLTLFMTLLAAFKVLVARLAGTEDVVVGTPIAGRELPEVKDLIGIFLNSLVLRTDLGGNPSFEELAERVRQVTTAAYAHQDLPFEKVLAELQPERDLSRTPLFQLFFNMLNLPSQVLRLEGLTMEHLDLWEPPSKFDLTLYADDSEERIAFQLVYNAVLFSSCRTDEMLCQYEHVLEQVMDDPAMAVGAVELTTPAALAVLPDPRAELDAAWHGAVHGKVAEQAARNPRRVAVVDPHGRWTYGELVERSHRLAHRLIAGGVEPGDAVAIYAHRSATLAWAVLGTLEAGAAFVLLDPAYPGYHTAEILKKARPKAFLRLAAAPELPAAPAQHLDAVDGLVRLVLPAWQEARGFLAEHPATAPEVEVGADDVAVLSFTSGSTGEPKGIVGRHGSLTHFLPWQSEYFGLGDDERYSLLSGLAHDPLQRDLFTALCTGATLVVPDGEHLLDPGYLASWMRRVGITVAHLTPAMAQVLTETADGDAVPSLRRVFLTGDVLLRRDVERLRRLAPAAHAVNFYGSTETQRAVGFFEPAAGDTDEGASALPLGRGMPGVQLLVVGAGGRPAGVGELGEVWVRSPHLARGYLNDDDLTRERFRSGAFDDDGVPVYRTGDLGRYRADGCVVFAGRADTQVKIRGFRVEPGEIEARLSELGNVREAVVLPHGDGGAVWLAAYVVTRDDADTGRLDGGEEELRQALRRRLPEHMVPAAFVALPGLPLTPNGKVDRKALAALPVTPPRRRTVAPRSATEEVLAGIWGEVLGLEQVGVEDDFFQVGGHSLIATRVAARIREAFGVEVPLRDFFERPTLGAAAARIDALRRSAAERPLPPLEPARRDADLALSFGQERLWFLDQLEPDSPFYNLSTALRVVGELDAGALERGLETLVGRHESLRTVFERHDGGPVQRVRPAGEWRLRHVDLAHLPEAAAEAAVRRLAAEENRRPFDLASGPVLRATLLRRSAQRHVLLVTLHHIVADDWSMGVLLREAVTLYEDFAAGRPVSLAPLPVQYADYAAWQRAWLRDDELERQLSYWRERLADLGAALDLPTDRPRPPVQGFRGAHLSRSLAPRLVTALRALGRRHGSTLFMALLGGWSALLSRLTGQHDLPVGTVIANRRLRELEGLIGFFVNTLVMRLDLRSEAGGGPGFDALLEQSKEMALGAYAHQDLPFERLVQELPVERDLSRSPIFQVMLAMQNAPLERLEVRGLTFEPVGTVTPKANFDLGLSIRQAGDVLSIRAEYDVDLFDAVTVERHLGLLEQLLTRAVETPERGVTELPLLTPAERHQVEVEWNDTAAAAPGRPRGRHVHELFADRAQRHPEARAVVVTSPGGARELTYGELEEGANRLAHVLRRHGVGPDVPVALCFERSPELVLAMLAVLKAGGAHLSLDPEHPAGRLAYQIRDTGARLVVTEERRAELLAEAVDDGVRLLCLDRDAAEIAAASATDPAVAVDGGHLAYVFYTSGSTGRPKGVPISHRALANLAAWHRRTWRVSAADRAPMVAGVGFDATVWEIWPYLSVGAGLWPVDESVRLAPEALVSWLAEHEITVAWLPAPLAEAALQLPWPTDLELRTLLTGGDRVRLHPPPGLGFDVVNTYGPTEATVIVTAATLPDSGRSGRLPSIGRPFDNFRLYVADRRLATVPAGVFGELVIAGIGLSRGYLGRPALTAEKLVPDPWTPAGRLYRTGDLARWCADGSLDFRGRIDHQFKIRGVRIEPGEIENALSDHPRVREAAVVVDPERARIAAFFVAREAADGPPPDELRDFLSAVLPTAMVPAGFLDLDEIPLTPNGKVDRDALRQLARRTDDMEGFVAPRTPTEEIIAGIWAQVLGTERLGIERLGVDRVGLGHGFFELGGHSLLATRVVARMRRAFGVDVPLRTFFQNPTVEALASLVEAQQQAPGRAVPSLARRPPHLASSAPVSFAQRRMWFLHQMQPDSALYHIPIAVRLTGRLDRAVLGRSLEEIVRRHEVLRTTFPATGGQPRQAIAPASCVALPEVDLSWLEPARREREASRILEEDARRPFDLEHGPVLRTLLVRCRGDEHAVLLTLHHIVSDGWSSGVLVREMAGLYGIFSGVDGAAAPADPALQYADYAVWEQDWLQGDELERQLAYWRGRLDGAPPVLDLPADRPRPPLLSDRGARLVKHLGAAAAEELRSLCRGEGATLFMALLAAWGVVLSRHAGQDDVVVGSPVANRRFAELEELIGFFVNTLVLRQKIDAGSSFRDTLARLRQVALEAYEHQDLPFERLVEELAPERRMDTTPLFQVMLALQNAPAERLELPGLTLEGLPQDAGTAKFDVILSLTEGDREIHGLLEYRRDLFDATTMERLWHHFEALLADAGRHPERPVSELKMLRPAEVWQALGEWNVTDTRFPSRSSVPELFAARVERSADAVALVWEGAVLTYRELDERAARLARRLRRLGVGPEVAVAVALERSAVFVEAVLAVLKAGGVYVPVDPTYPPERQAFMLADAGAEVLVTRTDVDVAAGADPGPVRVDLDADPEAEMGTLRGAADLPCRVDSEARAYVVYTSGSTGRPKGISVSHRAVARLALETDYVDLGPGDRVGHASNISFDAATFELWGTLLTGAALVVVPPDTALDPAAFADLLRRRRLTTLFITTALFNQVAHLASDAFGGLSTLLFGGETVDPGWVRRVLETAPPERLLHVYGPTESTTFATWHRVDDLPAAAPTVPIGRPLANTTVFVVDRRLGPVPSGTPGQLLIGGAGLARGYVRRPGLSAAAFLPDPLSGTPGERLYATGDLVRQDHGGRVVFLGRVDHQVKLRGFRIEPGEVEAALAAQDGVEAAAVLVRDDAAGRAGEKYLAAYVVVEGSPPPTVAELRRRLQSELPAYMVPTAVVELESLPLNPNGKVDRAALRRLVAPDLALGTSTEYMAPRGPVEELMAGIWSEVLGVDRIGVNDSFFELGGHSLLATQTTSRIFETFQVTIPLRDFFTEPTVAALAAVVEKALAGMDDETRRRIARENSIPRRPPAQRIPLSFAQHRLWFLQRLMPESPYYNMPRAYHFSGELRYDVLTGAFHEIVRRHESLRTTFPVMDDEPTQSIAPELRIPLPVIDLSALPEGSRRPAAQHLGTGLVMRPFELDRGPLIRLLLVCLARRDHVFFLSIHHIVSDGWSQPVFINEIAALYKALSEGRPGLPEMPIQYSDFAVWQRRWLTEEMLESQLAYWQKRMAGAPELLELPADRPRPAVQRLAGAHARFTLPSHLADTLREASESHGVLLYVTLVSAFLVLLRRHTGHDDLVLGSPIANRNRKELEGLIGFLVNMLLVRVDFSTLRADRSTPERAGKMDFLDLVHAVQAMTLEAYDNQDLPFERLVGALRPERNLSYTPVFQVMFNLLNFPPPSEDLGDLVVESWKLGTGTSKYDLSFYLYERSRGQPLPGFFEYATALFDETTMRRMVGHLVNILETIATEPGTALADLPLLSAPERHEMLVELCSATPEDVQPPRTIHGLVEAQARRTPAAVALEAPGEALTYAELGRRAGALAHHLRQLGVGAEVLVGISLPRSADMVVALLAVLEAGGAYVPMDPSYPAARLAFMLDDARPAAVLTRGTSDLSQQGGVRVVDLGRLDGQGPGSDGSDGADEAPLPTVDPGQLAYVIYTSGSTGRPKGVAVTHATVVNFLRAMRRRPGLTENDVFLAVTTLSFDIAGLELYLPLMAGAKVVVASDDDVIDGGRLAAKVTASGATAMQATPATWNLLLATGFPGGGRLRVLSGGEALPRSLADRLLAESADVWNLYGPTETTIWSSVHRVGPRRHASEAGVLPLGRPITATAFYVQSWDGGLAPLGAPGELLIGGAGLARGYLGRPRLSAERFVPDACGARPGDRLYRTGDLVRYRPAGSLEFLGRIDHQVKVRGFRIELGEVEAALTRHAAVRQAVVVAQREDDGGDRLAAFFVPHGDAPTVEALRQDLGAALPDYMVPSVFVVLDHLPLTPSGKVDRRALPAADGSRPELGVAFQAPASPLERFIAGHWRQVLGVERIGVRDRFFDLGGNSIQAAIFVNALQKELGEIIHVTALFQAQSIADLVAFLERDYSAAVGRFKERYGEAGAAPDVVRPPDEGIDAFKVLEMRRLAAAERQDRRERRRARPRAAVHKPAHKPSAIFVLSPPRAGSTLLRVVLAGHPQLFAPPELELLPFTTLGERRAELAGAHAFAREGLVRAVMELEDCDGDAAKDLLARWEDDDMDIGEVYRRLYEGSGNRILVDKTTTYALDPEALARAEELFADPLYIHLSRHPCATIKSYVDVRLDQFLRFDTPFTARQQAELLWVIDHQNVLRFLGEVPRERCYHLRYEDLVTEPEAAVRGLCDWLRLDFVPEMLEPYRGPKMTDGIYTQSRMHGDPRFHEHSSIDAAVTEKWKDDYRLEDLADVTRELALSLGYPRSLGHPSLGDRDAAGRRDASSALTPVAQSGEDLPLSFAQERLWILDQIDPGTEAYNVTTAVRLRGRLDLAALGRAVTETRRRHASLRTTFHGRGGRPAQVIHPPPRACAVPLADLRRLAPEAREGELRRLLAAEASSSFDLSSGPLMRIRLVAMDQAEHVLQLNMHHIVSDGWSLAVVTEELALLYGAFRLAEPSPLPEIKVQYADYAAWQRRWLSGRVLEEHLDYWRTQLGDLDGGLDLPTDRPRRAVRTYRGDKEQVMLTPALSERLEELSRRQGVTLFMTLLAAFKVLLSRWSGKSDVVVGTPIATRRQDEAERLIGIFLNTLVLRTDLSPAPDDRGPDFLQVLGRLRDMALGAYEHQDLPFEKLLDELQPERDLSRTPLFQVFFNMLNLPSGNLEVPGLTLEGTGAVHDAPSKFDLTLYVLPRPGRIGFTLAYNADLFAASRMAELLAQYELLLEQIAADPRQAIASYSLRTATADSVLPDPRAELSAAWEGSVCELVARQAERAPRHLAVIGEDGEWTYRDLTAASGRLARRLVDAGVEPGRTVAIYAQRSPTLVWAVLGVLEAGGAFLILDPTYPAARQVEMLRLARPAACLRMEAAGPLPEELEHYLGELADCPRWDLPAWSDLEEPDAAASGEATLPPVGPDDLAYVAFTSGSSGAPKGILGRHGPLTHFLRWQQERFALGDADRYSLLSGLAHDPLQRDLFTSLCLGSTLVVPDARKIFETGYLADWMRRARVSVAHLTPAMGQLLTERPPGQDDVTLPSLRYTFLVGDALTARDVHRLRQLAPGLTCVNLFGTTETQRAVGYFVTSPAALAQDGAGEVLPLGRGMPDVQLLVVTPEGELAGIGELGEIWVRSPHLARGYLDDDSLTEERFRPNPFSRSAGPADRIYRTGDLGRYLPSGDVAFAGRADKQVKVRGFRIELAEVEAALGRHPEVVEAVVEARDSSTGDTSLLAWVVPAADGAVRPGQLRRYLWERLPRYMVPAHFGLLESLPLTPNGKVDRRALQRLTTPSTAQGAAFQPPEGELEERLASVWQEVLGVDKVGVHDNFFDLGGHSLLLVRLHSRLQEELGEELPLMDLFSHPNVRTLAEHVERRREAAEPGSTADGVDGARSRAQRQVAAQRRRRRARPQKR